MSPRLPFLVIVSLAVAAAVLTSDGGGRPEEPRAADAIAASRAEMSASTWFCAGGSATAQGAGDFADHSIVVEAGSQRLQGRITVVTGDVPAYGTASPPSAAAAGGAAASATSGPASGTTAPEGTTTVPASGTTAPEGTTTGPASGTTAPEGGTTVPEANTKVPAAAGSGEGGDEATSSEAVDERSTARRDDDRPAVRHFELAAGEQRRFRLGELVEAPLAAAVVELDVTRDLEVPPTTRRASLPRVAHEVRGPRGGDAAPCVTRSASTWHFAWGVTTRDARERLVLFNPYPNDVAVDAFFSTDRGSREPLRWQGLAVPAQSVVAVDVGADVTRRGHVAATLRVRGGRLVVDRLQDFDGRSGSAGLTVATGVPEASSHWAFGEGVVDDRHTERIVLYNPGEDVAEVDVVVAGDPTGATAAPEPFGIVVRPGSYEMLDLGRQARVARGVAHTIEVRSRNGVPVVAERLTGTRTPPAAGSPPPGSTAGTPPAQTWRWDTDLPVVGEGIP